MATMSAFRLLGVGGAQQVKMQPNGSIMRRWRLVGLSSAIFSTGALPDDQDHDGNRHPTGFAGDIVSFGLALAILACLGLWNDVAGLDECPATPWFVSSCS
jgi:hypothetical protein